LSSVSLRRFSATITPSSRDATPASACVISIGANVPTSTFFLLRSKRSCASFRLCFETLTAARAAATSQYASSTDLSVSSTRRLNSSSLMRASLRARTREAVFTSRPKPLRSGRLKLNARATLVSSEF